jgi:hypothetical protein
LLLICKLLANAIVRQLKQLRLKAPSFLEAIKLADAHPLQCMHSHANRDTVRSFGPLDIAPSLQRPAQDPLDFSDDITLVRQLGVNPLHHLRMMLAKAVASELPAFSLVRRLAHTPSKRALDGRLDISHASSFDISFRQLTLLDELLCHPVAALGGRIPDLRNHCDINTATIADKLPLIMVNKIAITLELAATRNTDRRKLELYAEYLL